MPPRSVVPPARSGDDGAMVSGSADRRIEELTRRTLVPSFGVMARAFADDPVLRWAQPRRFGDRAVFAGLHLAMHAMPGVGDVVFDHGTMVGASYWDPPGYHPPLARQVASLPVLLAGVTTGAARGARLVKVLLERRPEEPHWYLAVLGAATPGRGVGTALLERGVERIVGPAYLESSNPRNVPLYERYGFEPLEPISVAGSPELIPMYRRAG